MEEVQVEGWIAQPALAGVPQLRKVLCSPDPGDLYLYRCCFHGLMLCVTLSFDRRKIFVVPAAGRLRVSDTLPVGTVLPMILLFFICWLVLANAILEYNKWDLALSSNSHGLMRTGM